MTEVDAVIPENVSLPVQSQTGSSENTELNSNVDAPNKGSLETTDNLNGDKCKNPNEQTEAMEVDAPDTEEDDSQITSSSENCAGGEDSKPFEETGKRSPITSTENSKESIPEPEAVSAKHKLAQEDVSISKLNSSSSNEDSSSTCDGNSQNCDSSNIKPSNDECQNSDTELPTTTVSDKNEDVENSRDNVPENLEKSEKSHANDVANTDAEATSQDLSSIEKTANKKDCDEDKISTETEPKEEKPNDVPADKCAEPMDIGDNPLHTSNDRKEDKPGQQENGTVSETERAKDDAGIVDLGDDSDEEIEGAVPMKEPPKEQNSNSIAEKQVNAVDLSGSKAKSVSSDSDGAVVIGSDSDNEDEQPAPPKVKAPEQKVEVPQEIVDDDDDDCVVIEDDTPAPIHADVSKRKNMLPDSATNSDDSQPPIKRQRTALPSTVNQITIKDARTLMPQDMSCLKEGINDAVGIYPVNIRPSGTVQGPPKLVPMSNPVNPAFSPMPGLSTNANLLPGLTDDMFVLEAPSFIVPYIYEKPPADNLKDVVKVIESKYGLSKEDLADADKSDEFDMMTEQNKEDKEEKGGKKKKKRRGGDDGDESWSEESDEDDDEEDDDDSESGVRTKVLIKEANDDLTALKGAIKPAAAVAGITPSGPNVLAKPGQENYFESPLGKFFMDIGVGLVQEFVQTDLIRLQKRKMRKSIGKNLSEFERAIAALSGNLEASKKKNQPFKFTMKRCEFCNFKSESALSMANHYETPHMNGPLYKCNFCTFEIRSANEIVYHMEAVHNIKARLIKPLPYHQCPNCGFEDNGKAKLARHQPVCAKKFRPELNLSPPHDWEAPAKIPRIKPRHGLVGTATAYQAMAAQAAAQKAALASIQQQQQQAAQARSLQAAALAAQNAANKIRGRPPTIPKQGPNPGAAVIRGPNQVRSPMATNVVMPNNYQLAGAQLIQNANAMAKKTLSGQPSISITPLPRQSGSAQASSPSSSKMPPAGMKPGQSPSGNKAQFVICEICDGYIKDLEQLRNHMQWMHKVKIHPKMIYNRPPLNCQKCQFRFFTDQGLERHLLGSHGLVTSSMQEAANKGKDAGRCPVCGRLYQWKLLNHVSRDHHMTLKPAHLSYKCTVCTATFGMYKQFETHVYTAHSTVAKKAMDGKKSNNAAASSTVAAGTQRSSLGATNDSLLKPLKINDEITIIPQPASKSRITHMESHVID